MTAGLILLRLGTGRGIGWMAALGRVLMVVGPTIGVSRLILGVHWPSDVVAGWAFGSTATLACALALWDPLHHGWAGSAPATARRRPVGPGAT
jgi:undecaprenyl-diphosphatase